MPSNSQFEVKVDGSPLATEDAEKLQEIVVNTDRDLPAMCTLTFNLAPDEAGKTELVDSDKLSLGKQVEVSLQARDDSTVSEPVFKGEITALEPQFEPNRGVTYLVRGYDKGHRLLRGTFTRTFLKMKDSDIAQKIAGEAGLSGEVEATSVQYDYVLQYNQTNLEFLHARAARIGYQVYVDDGKLCFKKDATKLGEGPTLEWGETLKRFEPRLTTAHQVNELSAQGWDVKQKKAIAGKSTAQAQVTSIGFGKTGGAAAQSAFSSAKSLVADQPMATADEAKQVAEGTLNQLGSNFVQAEGECPGDPRIRAGKLIEIKGVGTRFSGKYFVTSATHTYRRGEYTTQFSITGYDPNTLSHLLGADEYRAEQQGRARGLVVGLITNNKDPDELGRVKVKFPWLSDQDESQWARIAAPMAGKERGFFFLPEVDDEVLVAFEHDDVNYPYIVGALWNGKDATPEKASTVVGSDGKVNQRIIKSRSGHVIILDDKQGKEQIVIRDKTEKNEIVIDSAKNSMTIKVDQDFTIEAKGNVTVKTTGGDMSLECKNFNVKANMKASIQGSSGLELKSSASAKLEGAMVEVKGSGSGKFDGGGMLELKGGLVKIN